MKKNNGYLKRPFALIGLTFFVTVWLLVTFGVSICTFLLPFFFSVIVLIILFRFKERAAVLIVISITAVSACLCFLKQDNEFNYISSFEGDNCHIVGTLSEIPGNGKSNIVIKTEFINSVSVNTKVNISIYNVDDIGFDYCDKVEVKAKVFSLEKMNKSTANSYKSKGIFLTGYCGIDDIKLDKNQDKPLMYKALKAKEAICKRVLDVLPNETGGLIIALVLGDKSFITDKTDENFRISGISHLTAVSGMHTYFWSSIIFLFLRTFMSERKSAVFCIAFLVFFMTITGFTPSVVRAGVMVILTYCAYIFRKKSDSLNSIGLSALVITTFNPYAVCSTGTLLSFSAALGLIFMRDRIQKLNNLISSKIKIAFVRNIVLSVFGVLFTSLIATVSTFPVTVFTIGDLSLIGIIGNLLTVNISMYVMITGGIGAVLSLLPQTRFAGYPFLFISGILSKTILKVIDRLSAFCSLYVGVDDWFIKAFVIIIVALFVLFAIVKPELLKKRTVVFIMTVNVFFISCVSNFILESVSLRVDCIGTERNVCVLLSKGDNAVLIGECSGSYCIRKIDGELSGLENKTLDIAHDKGIKRTQINNYCDNNTVFVTANSKYNWCGYLIEFVDDNRASYCKITGENNLLVAFSGKINQKDDYKALFCKDGYEDKAQNINAEEFVIVKPGQAVTKFYIEQ